MDENISLFISDTLDTMGYDEQMNSFRNSAHDKIKHFIYESQETRNMETVLGCKCMILDSGEVFFIKQNVRCVSHANLVSGRQENGILFESEMDGTPPGYTRLKLLKGQLHNEDDISDSLCGNRTYYLRSLCYFNKMKCKLLARTAFEINSMTQPITGPGIATCFKKGIFNFPLTFTADEAFAETMRNKYFNRPYGWPTDRQINDISQMERLVVPAFSSDSELSYLEWRICYTKAEQELYHSLNIAQFKLYILLKLISNSTLKHISNDINSYVMKNIVFWMATIYPADIFQEKYLIILLLIALGLLYNCINSGFIPCYVTENINLLGVTDVLRKRDLLEMLYTMQQEKGRMLLRCERIRCAMMMKFKSPHLTDMYTRERNRLEQMVLVLDFIQAKYASGTRNSKELKGLLLADKDWLRVVNYVFDVVLPDWKEQFIRGENVPEVVISRIKEILHID